MQFLCFFLQILEFLTKTFIFGNQGGCTRTQCTSPRSATGSTFDWSSHIYNSQKPFLYPKRHTHKLTYQSLLAQLLKNDHSRKSLSTRLWLQRDLFTYLLPLKFIQKRFTIKFFIVHLFGIEIKERFVHLTV